MSDTANAKKGNKASKIVGIISTIFCVLCVGILLYSTISYSQTGLVNFFGYSFHVIQSPSMEPEIKVGDLVIVQKVSFDQIDVGDDILFKCEDTTSHVYGMFVVHRVIEKTETEGVYKTQGVNNPGPDKVPSRAQGKVVSVNSSLGGLFKFMTQGRNIIFVIAIFGVFIFTVMQLCSVIANASKLKQEKDKEKLEKNNEFREQLKKEVEAELLNNKANTSDNIEQNDVNVDNAENNNEQKDDQKETQTGGDEV